MHSLSGSDRLPRDRGGWGNNSRANCLLSILITQHLINNVGWILRELLSSPSGFQEKIGVLKKKQKRTTFAWDVWCIKKDAIIAIFCFLFSLSGSLFSPAFFLPFGPEPEKEDSQVNCCATKNDLLSPFLLVFFSVLRGDGKKSLLSQNGKLCTAQFSASGSPRHINSLWRANNLIDNWMFSFKKAEVQPAFFPYYGKMVGHDARER